MCFSCLGSSIRGSGNSHNAKDLEMPTHKERVVFVSGKSLSSVLECRNIGLKGKWKFRYSAEKKELCTSPHSGDATKSDL